MKVGLPYVLDKTRYFALLSHVILLYFEKPFIWAYFLNDLFFGSYAL